MKSMRFIHMPTGKVAKVLRRDDDTVTYIMDGFLSHAHIDWFMENFKRA